MEVESEQNNLLIERKEEVKDANLSQYLTFSLGKEDYGIDISNIVEIVGVQSITLLPNMPDYVKGVINLRGTVIPVIDVRLRFNMEERDYDARTCIVVVTINQTSLGLIVDGVSDVLDININNIERPPQLAESQNNQFVKGLAKADDSVKILLDLQNIVAEDIELLENQIN